MPDDTHINLQQTAAALPQELETRTIERADALARQSATSEILSVLSRSPSDIRPVFEAIVARAAQLCEAELSSVFRFEDGRLYLVAVHSLSPEEAAAVHSVFPRPPARNCIVGRAFLDIRPVQIEDVLAEPDYDARIREGPQSVIAFRSAFGVPICCDGSTSLAASGARSSPSPPPSSSSSRPLPTRPSSQWRTRGCSANCRPALTS
jgi:two-component system, NtrC family, sensor kinase